MDPFAQEQLVGFSDSQSARPEASWPRTAAASVRASRKDPESFRLRILPVTIVNKNGVNSKDKHTNFCPELKAEY